MTNSEAIETLRANYPDSCFGLLRDAVDTAIYALSAEPEKTEYIPDTKAIPSKRDCVDLAERVTATFYDEQYEEWTQKTVTIADVLDSVCDDYTVLPFIQPERLTDDDFETIRIHLNAYKENLCNQQRWKEAEEYQRIIDRFMAFASAQPVAKDINVPTNDCISRQALCEYALNQKDKSVTPNDIMRFPSAQPKTGRWVLHTYMPHVAYCTICERNSPYNRRWDFCPNCGADMRGGEDE